MEDKLVADQLVETWAIHNRINLYLLDAIPEEALADALPKSRTVHDLFGHIHNVRLMWLRPAAPEYLEGLETVETKKISNKKRLRASLEASGECVGKLLGKAVEECGKVKGFKPHVFAFLGYMISHESHHRGQIGWTLKQNGHPLPPKIAYGLWEWGVR